MPLTSRRRLSSEQLAASSLTAQRSKDAKHQTEDNLVQGIRFKIRANNEIVDSPHFNSPRQPAAVYNTCRAIMSVFNIHERDNLS